MACDIKYGGQVDEFYTNNRLKINEGIGSFYE
jgi:hypothetical protein